MAQQFISLIKFRRGSNENGLREATTFQEGEPVYETDTQRTFIGTGSTTPGEKNTVLMGNKVFWDNGQITDTESFTVPGAYGNDILYKNNKLWLKAQDDRSSDVWIDINPKLESGKLKYNEDNEITIEDSAITYNAGWGIRIVNNTISVRTDSLSPLVINAADELSMREGGIRYNFINQESFDQSVFLFDDTNSLISLNLNRAYFSTASGSITISNVPTAPVENVFKSFINQSENNILTFNNNTKLTLSDDIKKLDDNSNLIGAKVGVDKLGIVNDSTDTSYNGTLEEDTTWAGNTRKVIRVYTDNYAPTPAEITAHGEDAYSTLIKSAGFITLDNGTTADGKLYKKYAVPAFELPGEPEIICSANPFDDGNYYTYYYFGKNFAGGRFTSNINGSKIPTFIGKLNEFSEFDDLSDEFYYVSVYNWNQTFTLKTISGKFEMPRYMSQEDNGIPIPFIGRYEKVGSDYNIKIYIDNRINALQYNESTIEVYSVNSPLENPRTLTLADCTFDTISLETDGLSISTITNNTAFSSTGGIDHIVVTIKDGALQESYVLSEADGNLINAWK